MKLYCGIDLHSSNNVVAVSDEQDRPLYEKRLSNDLDAILTVLKPSKGELVGCVELTYNWYWLVEAGFPVRPFKKI
jgi:transposase